MSSLPALFGVLVFTFLLMRVLPGDPAVFFASGPNAGKEEIEVIRKQMGLDKPVPEQLLLYLYDVGRGNLGHRLDAFGLLGDLSVQPDLFQLGGAFRLVTHQFPQNSLARISGQRPVYAPSYHASQR